MKKKLLIPFVSGFLAVILFMGFSNGPKIGHTNEKEPGNHNTFTQGVPLTSPVFMLSFGVESFENPTFPPAGWSRFSSFVPPNVIQWERITVGTLPPGWNPGFGLEATAPPGGGNATAMITYDGAGSSGNDCWFVTPKIYNVSTTDSLVFWIQNSANFADNLDVKISKTTNNNAAAFSITAALYTWTAGNTNVTWSRKSIYLGSVAGINNGDSIYVGFREHVADNFVDGGIVNLDLVQGIGSLVVGLGNNNGLVADKFGIAQNYPNPFNPSTTINYNMAKTGNVKISVYDVLGNEVATLVNDNKIAGTHQVVFNASNLSSGIYFYKMQTGDFTQVKRMTLMK